MMRLGMSLRGIGRALGVDGKTVRKSLGLLPPRMAWAFHQLGDRKGVAAWLARSNEPTNCGFLPSCRVTDDEAAIRFYLEAIATKELPIWQAYGALRLRRMEARLGKAAVDRVKKSLPKTPSTKKKLEVTSVADFYARFAEIATAIRQRWKISDPPRPMSEAAIAKLRLPASRSSGKPRVPVPARCRHAMMDRGRREPRRCHPRVRWHRLAAVRARARELAGDRETEERGESSAS
jgi:hypothetical protein